MTARSAPRLRSLLSTRAVTLGFGGPDHREPVGSPDDLGYPKWVSAQALATRLGIV